MNLKEQIFRKLDPNPFRKDYYETEKKWFASRIKEMTVGNCSMILVDIDSSLQGTMYSEKMKIKGVPVFKINNQTWMSLTPMEVETHYIPIKLSWGRVGVGGLGAGYFVQRILEKESVEEVVVYEINQDVIDHYREQFGTHEKLIIKKEDALRVENEEFQFFYMDIYPSGMDEEAIPHMKRMIYHNNIDEYHFWTQEAIYTELVVADHMQDIPLDWKMRYHPFVLSLLEEKEKKLVLQGDGDDWFELLEKNNWCEAY